MSKSYNKNKKIIDKILANKEYDKLLEFCDFKLEKIFTDDFFQDCKNNNVLVKHLIDNALDLECRNKDKQRPIHFICKYSNKEMLLHILSKNVELECQDHLGQRPIHLLCELSTPDVIKILIDKGVDLESKDKYNYRPIHLICQYQPPEMIKDIIDRNVDLECEDIDNVRPVHYIKRYCNEMLQYIIDKGVKHDDLETLIPVEY